eukprot:Lankesteria_metandrocarpae@DN9923_c0_g1_i1.p1
MIHMKQVLEESFTHLEDLVDEHQELTTGLQQLENRASHRGNQLGVVEILGRIISSTIRTGETDSADIPSTTVDNVRQRVVDDGISSCNGIISADGVHVLSGTAVHRGNTTTVKRPGTRNPAMAFADRLRTATQLGLTKLLIPKEANETKEDQEASPTIDGDRGFMPSTDNPAAVATSNDNLENHFHTPREDGTTETDHGDLESVEGQFSRTMNLSPLSTEAESAVGGTSLAETSQQSGVKQQVVGKATTQNIPPLRTASNSAAEWPAQNSSVVQGEIPAAISSRAR